MMPSSLSRDSESISISKSWLPSMGCVLPDPVCQYVMINTLYLFSEHTISIIINNKCSKIYTASSACLNDWTTNTIDFIFRIFKLNKNIFFLYFSNSSHTRPNNFGFARYWSWWSSSCSLFGCYKTRESKAVPWKRRLDYQPLFGKWPHASLSKGRN